ncbi:hypothetical protein O181_062197 [Austropuccinia psidii MF-1]|uniref:Uncharacterized protein n=1 Tax=Austropuccinia psidii MF-1 TaxID=1389203 RepID=A0A9Q3ERT5_9BASI|nr:hypothetical protein [Austropuccinia psidii MF-1]
MFPGVKHVQCENEGAVNVETINTHEKCHISLTNQKKNLPFKNKPSITYTETAHELKMVRYVDQSQEIDSNANEKGKNNSTIGPLDPIQSTSR